MKVVDHTLNKIINLEICEPCKPCIARPIALPGNSILVCDKKEVIVGGKSIDLAFVGETHTVKTKIIKKALNDGYILSSRHGL